MHGAAASRNEIRPPSMLPYQLCSGCCRAKAFSALIMSSVLKGLARALASTAWQGSDRASQAIFPTDLTTRADSCQVLLSSNGIFQRFLLKLLPPTAMERGLLSRAVAVCTACICQLTLLNSVWEESAWSQGSTIHL